MNELAKLFTDESKLVFANGEVIEGAENVIAFILEVCKGYNRGYIKGYIGALQKNAVTGAAIGLAVGGTYLLYTKNREIRRLKEGKGA